MKLLIALLLSVNCYATNYYISPSGNDGNAGTIGSPWKTITHGWSLLTPGDTLFCRGGTYLMAGETNLSNKTGTSGNMICVYAYPGENPVFDWQGVTNAPNAGVLALDFSNITYVHIKGLRVTNLPQNNPSQFYNYGFFLSAATNCIIEQCEADHIGGSGFRIGDSSTGNLTLNCDSHDNQDPYSPNGQYQNANGYEIAGNVQGHSNTIRKCRAWWNADDGFDCFNGSANNIIDSCWSFWNGYIPGTFTAAGNGDGFKLGPSALTTTDNLRTVTNCLSFANRFFGFDQNFNSSGTLQMTLYNNTAYNNVNVGFFFEGWTAINTLRNNLSYANGGGGQAGAINSQSVQDHNSWNGGVSMSDADFVSVSTTGVTGARVNGQLPILGFMKLVSSSDLIDKGVNVGLAFNGAAPDLGCYEYSGGGGNILPTTNAGVDRNLTAGTTSVTISGASASDADGTIQSIAWSKTLGAAVTITGGNTLTPTFSGLTTGTYQFQVLVTDNSGGTAFDVMQVTVASPSNILPVANAGSDITITLPVNSVNLTGSGTDADGSIASYQWTKSSGPVSYTITSATSANTAVNNLTQGVYQFQLKVTDNSGGTATDVVQVTVNAGVAPPNVLPVAHAGVDQTVTLPTNTVILTGSGTDADGTISSYNWTKTAGPSTFFISTPLAAQTTITNLVQGTYQFQLQVTDNSGGSSSDIVVITVNPPPSNPCGYAPISKAGNDATVFLPSTSYQFNGLAADYDGVILSTKWVELSGPNTANIETPGAVYSTVSGLVRGTYKFRMYATDNCNNTVYDDMILTVKKCSFWDKFFGGCK